MDHELQAALEASELEAALAESRRQASLPHAPRRAESQHDEAMAAAIAASLAEAPGGVARQHASAYTPIIGGGAPLSNSLKEGEELSRPTTYQR